MLLLQRGFGLLERGLGLRDLMIELGRRDLGQKLACLDAVADIDIALVDIAAGPREDVRRRECRGRGGQGDEHWCCRLACTAPTRTLGTKSQALLGLAITSCCCCW